MRIKLDENLSVQLKPLLQQQGHEVETVEDEGILGSDDVQIGAAAIAENRILVVVDLDRIRVHKHSILNAVEE